MATHKIPLLEGVNNLIIPQKLGIGTPSGTNFLRGDQTWTVPSGMEIDNIITAETTIEGLLSALVCIDNDGNIITI